MTIKYKISHRKNYNQPNGETMIRSIKNIFAIATLTLLCVPALHGNDLKQQEQTANESTVICDTLKNLITQADVTEFKTTYDTFIESCVPERSAVIQELVTTAEDVKQKLEKELENTGDNTTNKKTLAKGVLQTLGGLYGIANVAFVYWLQHLNVTTHITTEEKILNSLRGMDNETVRMRIIRDKIAPYSFLGFANDAMLIASDLGKKLTTTTPSRGTSWFEFSPFIPGGFPFLFLASITCISSYQIKYGLNKIKIGYDYKAYLEQQIKNLDEIITHINTQADLK